MRKIFNFFEKIIIKYHSYKFKILINSKNKVKCLGRINLINKNIIVGENVIIYPNVSFEGEGKIIIGDNVKIGTNTIISSNKNGGVYIGNNTIIAGNNYIIDSNHNTNKDFLIQKQGFDVEKILIGEDVWIGCNCSIIKGSYIDNGVIIGANSLVNNKIEKNSIAVGTPAKIIKYRK